MRNYLNILQKNLKSLICISPSSFILIALNNYKNKTNKLRSQGKNKVVETFKAFVYIYICFIMKIEWDNWAANQTRIALIEEQQRKVWSFSGCKLCSCVSRWMMTHQTCFIHTHSGQRWLSKYGQWLVLNYVVGAAVAVGGVEVGGVHLRAVPESLSSLHLHRVSSPPVGLHPDNQVLFSALLRARQQTQPWRPSRRKCRCWSWIRRMR